VRLDGLSLISISAYNDSIPVSLSGVLAQTSSQVLCTEPYWDSLVTSPTAWGDFKEYYEGVSELPASAIDAAFKNCHAHIADQLLWDQNRRLALLDIDGVVDVVGPLVPLKREDDVEGCSMVLYRRSARNDPILNGSNWHELRGTSCGFRFSSPKIFKKQIGGPEFEDATCWAARPSVNLDDEGVDLSEDSNCCPYDSDQRGGLPIISKFLQLDRSPYQQRVSQCLPAVTGLCQVLTVALYRRSKFTTHRVVMWIFLTSNCCWSVLTKRW
jgi:hypothetical protein